MSCEPKESCYIFVVDTTEYAGNFEREMTAYMTGEIGECEVGSSLAGQFKEDYPELDFYEYVAKVADEHGCLRPCSIWPTLGWFNDGRGGLYRDGQEEEAWKNYQKKTKLDKGGYVSESLEKWPAYMSVAIFWDKFPHEHISLFVDRAKEFAIKEHITITGFRLIKREVTIVDNLIEKIELL